MLFILQHGHVTVLCSQNKALLSLLFIEFNEIDLHRMSRGRGGGVVDVLEEKSCGDQAKKLMAKGEWWWGEEG